MIVSKEYECVEGSDQGNVYNTEASVGVIVAPTKFPSNNWVSVSTPCDAGIAVHIRRPLL